MRKESTQNKFIFLLAVLVLGLYPFRHILFGVEWWDTGYNYANFLFMKQMDPMWVAGTFLSTLMGHLFTILPFGKYMWGLNMYTSVTVSILAVVSFFFFVKKVSLPLPVVFLGEFFAECMCWCPTALLYNYLTYVLFGAGCIFLYLALIRPYDIWDKKRILYFIMAGFFLGINVFTRLPNLAEMGMIVAVWAMAIIEKKGFLCALWETLLCMAGYIVGILTGFFLVMETFGISQYFDGVARLLSMPSEASDYSLYSMIYSQYMGYWLSVYWVKYLLFAAGAVTIIALIFMKVVKNRKLLSVMIRGVAAAAFIGCMVFYYYQKMFLPDYHKTASVFQFATFFLLFTHVCSVVVIFHKAFGNKDKLLAGMGILIIFITPLGSNNHLYSAVNNLFLIAPFQFYMFYKTLKLCKERVLLHGVQTMMMLYCAVLLIQAFFFGATYVFTEADGGKNLNTKVENNDILEGMITSHDRAEALSEISLFVKENDLKGKEVFLYGAIPSMSYYLEMPFVFTPWPDLRSYNLTVMKNDFDSLENEILLGQRELPVLLLSISQADFVTEHIAEPEYLAQDEKLLLIQEFYEKYHYQVVFRNDKFVMMTVK